jgi:hypothetical protein
LDRIVDGSRDDTQTSLVFALCQFDALYQSDVLTVHVESIAWSIRGDGPRAVALAILAAAARRGGADERADALVAEAERLARSLAPDAQAELPVFLAPAVPPERGRQLVCDALQRSPYGPAQAALAAVAPDIVILLADEHLAVAQPSNQP